MEKSVFNIATLSTVLMLMFAVIIFYSVPKKFAFCQECSVQMTIYDGNRENHIASILDNLLEKKKLYSFEFTGNSNADKETFKRYREKVHLLIKSNDTTKIIRFKFNRYTNYQNFIDAFDVCFVEGATYLYDKDDLWIINESRNHKRERISWPPIKQL